jgi:protein TonB
MDAVKNWRYRPYMLDNQPVAVDTTIKLVFSLTGE